MPARIFLHTYTSKENYIYSQRLNVFGAPGSSKAHLIQKGDIIVIRDGAVKNKLKLFGCCRAVGPVFDQEGTTPFRDFLWKDEQSADEIRYPLRVPVDFENAPNLTDREFAWDDLDAICYVKSNGRVAKGQQEWAKLFSGNLVAKESNIKRLCSLFGTGIELDLPADQDICKEHEVLDGLGRDYRDQFRAERQPRTAVPHGIGVVLTIILVIGLLWLGAWQAATIVVLAAALSVGAVLGYRSCDTVPAHPQDTAVDLSLTRSQLEILAHSGYVSGFDPQKGATDDEDDAEEEYRLSVNRQSARRLRDLFINRYDEIWREAGGKGGPFDTIDLTSSNANRELERIDCWMAVKSIETALGEDTATGFGTDRVDLGILEHGAVKLVHQKGEQLSQHQRKPDTTGPKPNGPLEFP